MAVLKVKPGGSILTLGIGLLTLTRTEWRCIALWSAIVLVPNSLPVMVGYRIPGDNKVLNGAVHYAKEMMRYLTKMRLSFHEEHVRAYQLAEWGP